METSIGILVVIAGGIGFLALIVAIAAVYLLLTISRLQERIALLLESLVQQNGKNNPPR